MRFQDLVRPSDSAVCTGCGEGVAAGEVFAVPGIDVAPLCGACALGLVEADCRSCGEVFTPYRATFGPDFPHEPAQWADSCADCVTGSEFCVEWLQAVEPSALPRDGVVTVFEHDEVDGQGFPTVTLTASSRGSLVAYVRRFWGDEGVDHVTVVEFPAVAS